MAHSRRGSAAAWLSLGAILVAMTAGAWRHFPMFLGDQGWYLQVAWRVSRGEVLYRDVAWAEYHATQNLRGRSGDFSRCSVEDERRKA